MEDNDDPVLEWPNRPDHPDDISLRAAAQAADLVAREKRRDHHRMHLVYGLLALLGLYLVATFSLAAYAIVYVAEPVTAKELANDVLIPLFDSITKSAAAFFGPLLAFALGWYFKN